MTKTYNVLYALGVVIFGGWAAHYFADSKQYVGLECSEGRISTFGWTHEDRALAEMAAILRWSEKAKKFGGDYTKWHHAQKRYLKCRTIGGPRGHYQCRIAATPCRRDVQQAGI